MEKKKRLDWLDASKAIGIYLVILGHLVIFNYHTFRFIFAFHMPFFFAAAGYVWKKQDSFREFFKKCCKHYLVPYFVVTVLGLLQCFCFPNASYNADNFKTYYVLTESFYYGWPIYSYFGSAWFLLAMFWAQLLFWGLERIRTKYNKVVVIVLWITVVALAVFAKDTFRAIPVFYRLPLKMDTALMGTVFIGVGALLKKAGIFEKSKWIFALLFAICGGIITWLFGCKLNYYVNISELYYGIARNFFVAAVAGCVMLFGLGRLLEKSNILKFIGQNTLFIFLGHQFVLEKVIKVTNDIFHQTLVGQDIPLNGWSIGISLVTLVILSLLARGYQSLKGLMKKKYKHIRANEQNA